MFNYFYLTLHKFFFFFLVTLFLLSIAKSQLKKIRKIIMHYDNNKSNNVNYNGNIYDS